MQRRSDGTLVIATRRFEIPNRYRHLREVHVRYAQWDLSQVHLLDERSGKILCRLLRAVSLADGPLIKISEG
jgi:hypothetical protein